MEDTKPTRAEKNNLLGQFTIAAALIMGQGKTREAAVIETLNIFGSLLDRIDPPLKNMEKTK